MNWIVFLVIIIFRVAAYRESQIRPTTTSRRKTFAWAWAFWGGVLGSFFGVAGFGGAIAGTSVGALIGYLGATAWLKVDPRDEAGKNGERTNPMADAEEIVRNGGRHSESYSNDSAENESGGEASGHPPSVGDTKDQYEGLPDQYFERVQLLKERIRNSELVTLSAIDAYSFSRSVVVRPLEDAARIEGDQIWWYDGNRLFIYINNRESYKITALEFTLTPGPCDKPTGFPLSIKLQLRRGIPAGSERVVAFWPPAGGLLDSKVQCGIITRVYSDD